MTSPEPEKAVPVVAWRYVPSEVWRGFVLTVDSGQADLARNMGRNVEQLVRLADHEAAMAALRAEVERLRADAERYRWLRAGVRRRQGIPVAGHRAIDRSPYVALMQFDFWCTPFELDSAIDIAIAAAHGAQGDSNAE